MASASPAESPSAPSDPLDVAENSNAGADARSLCCPPMGDPSLDEATAEELVVMLKALADPVRLRLMNLIIDQGESCACDLPAALDRSQPTISHHLSVLVNAGLLTREKRGKWAWFQARTDQLEAISRVFSTGR